MPGQEDDRQRRCRRCQAGLQLQSVQPGHLQIEQDTAGFDGGQSCQEFGA